MITRDTIARADSEHARDGEGVSAATKTLPFVVFRLGRIWLAVDAMVVAEVATARELTPIPGAPPRVPGLINLRGRAVPLFDMATYLDLPAEDHARSTLHRILVASSDGMRVGIPCDQVIGVSHLPVDEIKPVQVQRTPTLTRFSRGEIDREVGSVLVVELAAILRAARIGGA